MSAIQTSTGGSQAPAPLAPEAAPWWSYGHLWLVIAGPVAAIVVGVAMLVVALRIPDPVAADYYRKGLEINKALAAQERNQLPALLGRNHAASPDTAATATQPKTP